MTIEIKATVLALTTSLSLLGLTFGVSPLLKSGNAANPQQRRLAATVVAADGTNSDRLRRQGYKLFDQNCAPCHGDDARGDEGPDLHGLAKSDASLGAIIKGGIKGEMPAFARKFTDSDVQALVAYLHSLKD